MTPVQAVLDTNDDLRALKKHLQDILKNGIRAKNAIPTLVDPSPPKPHRGQDPFIGRTPWSFGG